MMRGSKSSSSDVFVVRKRDLYMSLAIVLILGCLYRLSFHMPSRSPYINVEYADVSAIVRHFIDVEEPVDEASSNNVAEYTGSVRIPVGQFSSGDLVRATCSRVYGRGLCLEWILSEGEENLCKLVPYEIVWVAADFIEEEEDNGRVINDNVYYE